MQRPTLQNVRIRSTRDALHVFHGVAINLLPLITRRLDAEERRAIVPGNVYVWWVLAARHLVANMLFIGQTSGRSVVLVLNRPALAWRDGVCYFRAGRCGAHGNTHDMMKD